MQCVAMAVSLHGTVLGSQPAAGGKPIQSAVMESKVTVHSCKIAMANCLCKRHPAERHKHTDTHTTHSPAVVVYPDNKKCTRVCVCVGVRGHVLLSLRVLVKYKERTAGQKCFMLFVSCMFTGVKCTSRNY